MRKRLHRIVPMFIRSRMESRDAVLYGVLFAGAVAAFALGIWGLTIWYPGQAPAESLSLGYVIYWTLRLFVLESGEIAGHLPWQLEVARFLAPAVMLSTAIKITSEFAKEFLQETRAARSRHILLVGDHALMPMLVEGYRKVSAVVALRWGENREQELDVKEWRFRGWPKSDVQEGKESFGKKMLERTRLEYASHAVIMHRESSVTLAILQDALAVLQENPQSMTSLHVHFDDAAALVVARRMVDSTPVHNQVYMTNLYEVAARELMMRFPPEQGRPMEEPVCVAIVGSGSLGQALCVQMGFSGHFACLRKSSVVWLDSQPERLLLGEKMLRMSYAQLDECMDFRCEKQEPLEYFAGLAPKDWQDLAQIWICLDDEVESSAMVDALQMLARKCLQGQPGEPVIHNHLALVQELMSDPEVLLRDKQSIDPMAKATHENYRAKYKPEGPAGEPWDCLSRNFREANRRSAEHLWVKLRAAGWDKPFPQLPTGSQARVLLAGKEELLSRMEKNRWNADRYLNGWVYGPVRDNARKIHNLLVPWEQLDALQQSKDTSNVMLIAELVEG